MATTKPAAPAKKSQGFQGGRGAFFLIIIMELPVSRSTVSAIGMRLLRQLLLK